MGLGGTRYGPLEVSKPLGTARLKKKLNVNCLGTAVVLQHSYWA
jgi:hypothetical protein